MPLLAQRGNALRPLPPLEVRSDRVPLGRIGRGDVLVDVQGIATRAGTDDQAAEGGDPRSGSGVAGVSQAPGTMTNVDTLRSSPWRVHSAPNIQSGFTG